MSVVFKVETEREADGRWIAEVVDLPGVLAYGASEDEALARVQALALRVVADRLEHGEAGGELLDISFQTEPPHHDPLPQGEGWVRAQSP